IRKKIVVLGDGAIGKTCLLAYFSTGVFPEKYVPTVFENVMFNLEVEGRPVELAVWDTAGQDDYARLRPLAYPDTDAFMLCYAIDQPDTFKNVEANWLPEIRHHCPYAPVLLVGLKADLRNS
ncbi:transforming protein RhoA, partial [Entophlyctis helioformis]